MACPTKYANDSIMDAALDWIKSNGVKMWVCTASICSGSTPSYSKITSSAALTAAISMAALASVSIANGDTSGRKITVPEQASVAVVCSSSSATAARICLVNSSGSVITYYTTCTSQVVTSGNTITVPAWDIEIRDPS